MPSSVSVIVPCYNEQATIGLLLSALLAQTYPRADLEVVIADALSQDGTRELVAGFQQTQSDLRVNMVDNPRRTIPSGLNLAVAAAHGQVIVRLDAHSQPLPEYVERCVADLDSGLGENVGGVWIVRPGGKGWIAESIAAAAAHPLGVGDALYRLGARAGPVDTVPFGAFRRELIERIGGFNESLLTNEDYEFNARIRQSGGTVWLDPQIRSTYFARASLDALARQYWRYGFWKFKMLREYPDTLRWRQALPPLFVATLLGLAVLSLFFASARLLLGFESTAYLCVLLLAGLELGVRRRNALLAPGLTVTILTMHLSWGSGFLWSIISLPFTDHG